MKGRGKPAKRHVGGVVHHKGPAHHKGDVHIHGGVHSHGKSEHRKRGGKIDGKAPEMRLDKRARGGRMTPKSPMSGASVHEKGFAHSTVPSIDEGGEGKPEGRSRGGRTGIRIKHPGKLHRDLGVPQGEKIPETKLAAALHSKSPALRKEANFARNAKEWHH